MHKGNTISNLRHSMNLYNNIINNKIYIFKFRLELYYIINNQCLINF